MSQLARYLIAREPDLALSVAASKRGWNLLTAAQSAEKTTSSPAGLLITPEQVSSIAPLAALKGSSAKSHRGLFDPLHATLESAYEAQDFAGMEEAASAFLRQHPIAPARDLGPDEQQIRRFFIFKGKSSTTEERLALYDGITKRGRDAWLRDAPARIDLEKAQALATAVSGLAPPRDSHLLGGLQADLAFAVLDACLAGLDPRQDRLKFPDKYVGYILSLAAFLPHFAFKAEICKTRDTAVAQPPSILAGRLDALKAYQEKLASLAGKTAPTAAKSSRARADKDKAAGTPGHTPDCDCTCNAPPCAPIDPCCAEVRWYTSELLTLKDKTWCYRPSDIAYIENVAPFETRIRTHGLTRTVTETSEDESNTSREEDRDHQVTDRFNLQTEINNSQKANLNVDAKLGSAASGYQIDTNASLSKDSAYREAREQAREDVSKATLKIQVQTRKLRTRSVSNETTETNKHKFKNSTALPAVAKYFWVTQEKRGQLFSYGPRVTVDLLVPSPAMLFQKMEDIKRASGFTLKEPKPFDIKVNEITKGNYEQLGAEYGVVDLPVPPEKPANQLEQVVVNADFDTDRKQPSGSMNYITIASRPGFFISAFGIGGNLSYTEVFKARMSNMTFEIAGADVWRSYNKHDVLKDKRDQSDPVHIIGPAPLIIRVTNVDKLSTTLNIVWSAEDPDLTEWRRTVLAKILEKYEAALADYKEALRAYNEAYEDKIKGRHPFACEEIMRTELKRSAIFLMCGEFDWSDVMNMDSELCHFPWPNRRKADKATNEWYFFDRAFDWNLASFTFYDYFRNPLCKWVDSYEPDEPNFLFKAFLRAGYARIQVPVSPGMEEDVKTYLQTGGLWGETGIWPTDPDDPRWISVIDEIKHSHDCYQQDREGHAEAYDELVNGQFDSRVRIYTDRYWKIGHGVDQDAINLDFDHQIFIDGIEYRIVSLIEEPSSPAYSAASGALPMQWIVGLDRALEFAPYIDPAAAKPALKPYNYAIGAKYVGAPFHFDLPTDLIWIGDVNNPCLPCYPIECVRDEPAKAEGADAGRAVSEKAV